MFNNGPTFSSAFKLFLISNASFLMDIVFPEPTSNTPERLTLRHLQNNLQNGIKVTFILFSVAIASIEDLLPIYGLYLSLMFTMDQNEDK